jgi:hypothetical protein
MAMPIRGTEKVRAVFPLSNGREAVVADTQVGRVRQRALVVLLGARGYGLSLSAISHAYGSMQEIDCQNPGRAFPKPKVVIA